MTIQPTSREAAFFVEPYTEKLREQIFLFIVRSGGATDDEFQQALRIRHQTGGPRRIELAKAGLVEDSGYRRETSSGAAAIVWIATGKPYDRAVFTTKNRRKRATRQQTWEREVIKAARSYSQESNGHTLTALVMVAKRNPELE